MTDVGQSDAGAGESAQVLHLALPNFQGPLDVLLHLIREHRIDILDIPIALITEKYLGWLDAMRQINIDVASEFLVMASTLMHIKSRLLLPPDMVAEGATDAPGEVVDPRAELVRRLLEYQKYKKAAEQLAASDILDRDVFPRRVIVEAVPLADGEMGLIEVSSYKLIEALAQVLSTLDPETQHEVVRDTVRLTETIAAVVARLEADRSISFRELLGQQKTRLGVIMTFLAILELCRLKLVRVQQEDSEAEIMVHAKPALAAHTDVSAGENSFEYA